MKLMSRSLFPVGVLAALALSTIYLQLAIAIESQPDQVVMKIEGMTCAGCEATVTKALRAVDGVKEVQVSFSEGLARVQFDASVTEHQSLATALTEAGYSSTIEQSSTGAACATKKTAADETSSAATKEGASCVRPQTDGTESQGPKLSDEQLAKIVSYAIEKLEGYEGGPLSMSRASIQDATGVEIPDHELMRINEAVAVELEKTEEGREILAHLSSGSGSRCQTYSACSLYGDLSGATGETLAMYEREKGEDGRTYSSFAIPEFQAFDRKGNPVEASTLKGKPTVLVFLAAHCRHSFDSLPILQSAVKKYAPQGLSVVGVFVNSGSVEDVNFALESFDPSYTVWSYNDAALGDLIQSHLVPTYLMIDTEGRVTEKLVGFKDEEVVNSRIESLLSTTTNSSPATSEEG